MKNYVGTFIWFCLCMLVAPIMWVLGEAGLEKAKEIFQLIKAGKKTQETEQ